MINEERLVLFVGGLCGWCGQLIIFGIGIVVGLGCVVMGMVVGDMFGSVAWLLWLMIFRWLLWCLISVVRFFI